MKSRFLWQIAAGVAATVVAAGVLAQPQASQPSPAYRFIDRVLAGDGPRR
jgi:hypothetical protein